MNIFQSLWLYWKGSFAIKHEIQFHSNDFHGWLHNTPSINSIFQYMGAYFIDGNFDFMYFNS